MSDPKTPAEMAEYRADMAAREAHLAISELCNLAADYTARPFVSAQERELWAIKSRLDLLLSSLMSKAA
jgi:hypothetical protein